MNASKANLSDTLKAQMLGKSWHWDIHRDCPDTPSLAELRVLTIPHRDFSDAVVPGTLITIAPLADELLKIFAEILRLDFPIEQMRPICHFEGDDGLSMAANNSSCFNSRRIRNTDRLSAHSYGGAVDINPVQNPVIRDGEIRPPQGNRYTDRTLHQPGMLENTGVIEVFAAAGWKWGGNWESPVDYHHFYKDERSD